MFTSEINATVNNSALEIIPGTNWTYADAASMAKECAREDRLFGRKQRSPRRHSRTAAQNADARAARFQNETGWSLADAISEAIESRRDHRLYGPSFYAHA